MTDHTIGTLVQIDPAEVIVGANVRLDARLDKRFVASIRERGVLVPIVGHHDEEGRFVVVYGQRRTLAAVESKQASIPAYVVATSEEADRLVDQMAENDHRAPLSTSERAQAFEQMAALGLSAAQIAKRTATHKEQVAAGLQVAGSELAAKAADRWDWLTLEQAAALAEFETDEEAVKRLTVAAQRGGFDHELQRLRDKRDEKAEQDAYAQELTKSGVRVVARVTYNDQSAKALRDLLTPEGESITAEAHEQCPGHAAYVERDWVYASDTDNAADANADEDETLDDDEQQDEQGRYVLGAAYVCTDYKAHGHVYRYATSASTGQTKAADMSEDEREAARLARRDVVESNKAWDSAETVRRQWVAQFLTRKTAPKGSAALIGLALFEDGGLVSRHTMTDLLAAFLGVKCDYASRDAAAAIGKATEARAQVLALGYVLASYEAQTGRHSWRNVNPGTARYLTFLAANGYELAPVEARAAGQTTK